MAVITVSREYGSDGTKIGTGLSESLGYLLVDKDLIHDVLVQYGFLSFNRVIEEKHSIWERFDNINTQIVEMLTRTMLSFASLDNCVILGRGGYYVLNEFENVLNVLIRAPFERRVENIIMRKEADNEKSAFKLLKEKDKQRSTFLSVFYGAQCKNTDMYNLVIDTSKVDVGTAQKWISEAAAEIDAADINVEKSTFGLEIDTILLNTVEQFKK